jgi:hypothetical protein
MIRTLKLFFVFLVTLGFVAPAACMAAESISESRSSSRTPDGRFNTLCLEGGRRGAWKELCSVSFYRLIAVPERYHGRPVAVSGYLIRVFGNALLFPSESSYHASALSEALEIMDAEIPKSVRGHLDEGVAGVLVVGIFDARYVGKGAWPLLGAIKQTYNVEQLLRLPSDP